MITVIFYVNQTWQSKKKYSPALKKIVVAQAPTGHRLHSLSGLAGKKKLSPPEKSIVAPPLHSGQDTSGAGGNISSAGAPTVAETTQDLTRSSSGSSSPLNLNSGDGIIDDYFDDVTNNNLPQSHQPEFNQGLSVTGTADSPHLSSQLSVNIDLREIINVPDSAEIKGSEGNLILIDSIPEAATNPTTQQRQSRPRRNVGPPQFYGNRRFIEVILEKDDMGTSHSSFIASPEKSRAIFTISFPSDFLTPLAEAPPRQTLIAETTLIWSTKNSCPSVTSVLFPITTLLNDTSLGSHSAHSTIKDCLDEIDNCGEISSTIDPEVKAKLDDFDEQFN